MSEDDDRWVGLRGLQLVETLRACQGICRMLAEEGLMRMPVGDRRPWLAAEREKLQRLLDQLGEPL